MFDVAYCNSEECTKKEECYRYKAKPEGWKVPIDFSKICIKIDKINIDLNSFEWFIQWQNTENQIIKQS